MASRSAVFGFVLAWFVAACADSPRLVAPLRKAALSSALQQDGGGGGVLGTFTLSAPAIAFYGMPATSTGIMLPSGVAVRVTVRGTMAFSPNPAWLSCFGPNYPPLASLSVGPAGFIPGGNFGVTVGEGDASGIQPGAFRSLSPQDASSDTAGIDLVGSGGVLWAQRSGVSELCGANTPAYLVSGSQTVSVVVAGGGGGCVAPPCPPPPPPVTIVASAKGPLSVSAANPNGSFTAKGPTRLLPPEDTIKLHATVTPPALAPRVVWQVKADPQHFPTPVLLPPPTSGADATFLVLALLPTRWPMDHEASKVLGPKQLSFVFTASVRDDQGQTHTSNPVTVTQNDTDTVREEYVEFARTDPDFHEIPGAFAFVTNVDADGHFSPVGEFSLNSGDYDLYWAQTIMLDGLDEMWFQLQHRIPSFSGFALTSVFRNPVHHVFHTIKNAQLWNNSAHQYGLAADIRVTDQPIPPTAFFAQLELVAHDPVVGACFEPLNSITGGDPDHILSHAHVDWMPACETGW